MGSNPAFGQLGSKHQLLRLFTVTVCVHRAPEIPSSTSPLLFSFVLVQQMCPGCEQRVVGTRYWLTGKGPLCAAWKFPDPRVMGTTQSYYFHVIDPTFWY